MKHHKGVNPQSYYTIANYNKINSRTFLIRYQYGSSDKNRGLANCCLKEVAKHEGDSHWYIFQCKTPEFQHSLTFQQILPHEEK